MDLLESVQGEIITNRDTIWKLMKLRQEVKREHQIMTFHT